MTVEDIVIRMSVEGEEELQQMLQISGMSMKQFNKHLRTNALVMSKTNQVTDQLTGKHLKLGQVMQKGMHQQRRFKMEWLSVMFAGMALTRAFGGLIKTQLQLWGVTEGMANMWTILFLPIMEEMTPKIWKLIEALMALDPGVQKAIGSFVIFLAVFGTILMVVGQVFLALRGFMLLWPGLTTAITRAGGVFKAMRIWLLGLSSTFLIVGAIVAAVAIGMHIAWKENFMGMKEIVSDFISGFKQAFSGIINIVRGVLNIVKGLFLGDFDLIKKGFMNLFKGFVNTITGLVNMVMSAVMAITVGVLRIVLGVVQTFINAIIAAGNAISKLLGIKGKMKKVDILSWLSKFDATAPKIPKWQTGGLVTATGPALLHRGERVIPKGRADGREVMFAPTVYITATISNDMDIRLLATKLNEFWVRDFERMAQTRGL